jgi:putative ABC transport system permease protein
MNWHIRIREEFARLGKPVDETVVEELAQHVAAAVEAARADGASATEAEAASVALIESWCRETTGPRRIARATSGESAPASTSPFAGLGLDVRLALRLMRRQPGFALVSISLIALAIASATSMFSIVNGIVLRPLPRVKMDGLVRVGEYDRLAGDDGRLVSNETWYAWHDAPTTIEGLATWDDVSLSYGEASGLELVRGARTSASLFPLLGVPPAMGSNFTEAQETTDDAIMLSYNFWRERFGGATDVLGRRVTIDGRPRTVIGVMPREFYFPDRETRVWLAGRPPNVIQSKTTTKLRTSVTMQFTRHNGLARLKPGVTPEQASAEAAARIADSTNQRRRSIGRTSADAVSRKVVLTPMLDWMIQDVKPALWILSAAVALLVATAIGNVATMQLSRATMRQREVAIRTAIGAGRRRIVRQLLVESSIVAAIGALAGLGVTAALLRVLPALMPEDFPRLEDIAIDGRVLAVATALTAAVALIMSLLPARMVLRVSLTNALVEDGAAPVGHSLRSPAARSRALIISGQVAVAALLLVSAGLLAQSLWKLIAVDRGYEPANLLTARIGQFSAGVPVSTRSAFYAEALEKLQALPGVTHAALSNDLPVARSSEGGEIHGRNPASPGQPIEGSVRVVGTDYLATLGMRLVRGRPFTASDVPNSGLVILVNETFAQRYIPGDALDALVWLDLDADRPCAPTAETRSACMNPWRVVGIVADVRQSGLEAPVQPEVFAPRSQFLSPPPTMQYVAVRTTGDPAALAFALRALVKEASPRAVVEEVMTMETRLMTSLARPQLYAVLLGGFAAFALVIAAIGLFGGLSYAVAQRTREFGVRTALGATPRGIMGLVLKQGAIMTLAGLVTGLGAAAAIVRYLAQFLFGVTPFDAATFVFVAAALLIVALVACGIPARRAARIDPIEAIRR